MHECCNYDNGNCILLNNGEPCVCVQSISYSLICRWFRIAVLPLDENEDENFIIDEEAAPVVKQIYSLCLAGNGPTKIARMLTEQEIPTPGTLEYRRTGSTRRYHPGYECRWATNTVAHILENREYTGCLANFKTEKPSYKVKHSVENPVEKQAVFENHHEPIIDRDTWERV